MAGTVDEQPCEESTQNGDGEKQEAPTETEGEPCPNGNGCPQTTLLNSINSNIHYVPAVEYPSDNIPMVSFTGMLTHNGPYEFEMLQVKKELKQFTMSMDEKACQQSDSDADSADNMAPQPTWMLCASITVLLLANTLNYMDRYTIAGVLKDVIDYYEINNSYAGLLQTAFIVSYMFLSPIFGYMGDRYNRKLIMAGGIFFWSIVTLAGSFVPRHHFWAFLALRGMVGVGEASYSTIAPTIISDLFLGNMRTVALTIFYFAIPVGSGLGYIVGANVAHLMGSWQWALRVTPPMGILCVVGILVVVREPPRGALEGGSHLHTTAWMADIKHLLKNKSFLLSTAGFTCVTFVAGALALWGPIFMQLSIQVQADYMEEAKISLIFGVITCFAGFFGVAIGTFMAGQLRNKMSNSDPIVCASGLIAAAPFFYFAMVLSKHNTAITWVLIFVGETLICLNWAIVTDMLLYIVIPTRRSTAEAIQILISHLFGDAGSPYLVGVVSDALGRSFISSGRVNPAAQFLSLQYAMYMTCFVCVLGGMFFLFTALFINQDKAKADRAIKGTQVASDLTLSGDQSTLEESLPNLVANINGDSIRV